MTSNDLRPTKRSPSRLPKASDVLAERLRARILGDGMEVGASLASEAEILAEYGYSRGTVREALRLLEAEGLIRVGRGPRGGVLVERPDVTQVARAFALILTTSEASMRAFMDVRMLIEPAAAVAAASSATPQQRQWLLTVAQQESGGHSASESWIEFHQAVGECCNNEVLRLIIAALSQEISWHLPYEQLDEDANGTITSTHRAIAEAIATADAPRAEKLMHRHVEAFRDILDKQGRLDEPVVPRSHWRARW